MTAVTEQQLGALLFDRIPHGIFAVDEQHRITAFDAAAEAIAGWTPQEAIGQRCQDVSRSDHCGTDCSQKRSMRLGDAVRDQRMQISRNTLWRKMQRYAIT